MKCAAHPNVETNLRCGKCGKPICPKCIVQTPVGARCAECARLYKLPTYRVSTAYYLRAIGTALGLAIVGGIIWGALADFVPFFFISVLAGVGVGYVISSVVGLAVNRKRGTGLAIVAGVAVVVSYLVSILVWGLPFGVIRIIIDIIAVAVGVYIAVNRLR